MKEIYVYRAELNVFQFRASYTLSRVLRLIALGSLKWSLTILININLSLTNSFVLFRD